jgi:RsiW-degrading membrane proteinase PrsW (M82 family)
VAKSLKLTRRGKALFYLVCAVLLLFSAFMSYYLAGDINSFFKGVLRGETQTRIEAPIVEELLKPLGLVILAAALSLTNHKRSVRIDLLKSMNVDYVIGYTSGLVFGVLESGITYHTLSGLRAVTPFFHAFTTGMVGIGIYLVLTGGKKEIVKLIPIYIFAVFLHSTWNTIGSYAVHVVFGLSVIIIGLGPLLVKLKRKPAKVKSVRSIRGRRAKGCFDLALNTTTL